MWFNKKNQNKEESRELIVHYVELAIICVVFIGIILGIRTLYRNDQTYKNTIPVMHGTISEIKPGEVETYVFENENALLYLGTSQDESCRKLEKEFKPYILEKGLEERITYLNLTEIKDINIYLTDFSKEFSGTNIDLYPAIVLFKDGKIVSSINRTDKYLTLDEIKMFLDNNKIRGTK